MAVSKKPSSECLKYLKSRFLYNPTTGVITWKIGNSKGSIKPGQKAGFIEPSGYIRIKYSVNKKCYRVVAHCLAWFLYYGSWPDDEVDHKNGVKINNWIFNLRIAKPGQNQANKKVSTRSLTGIKGVSKRGSYYISQIEKNGKVYFSSSRLSLEEARAWYRKMQYEMHGEFASHLGAEAEIKYQFPFMRGKSRCSKP